MQMQLVNMAHQRQVRFPTKGGWVHMHVAQTFLNANCKTKTLWGLVSIEAKVRQPEEIVVGLKIRSLSLSYK